MTDTPTRPLRVLHVLGALNRGGVETWLLRLLRQADRSQLAMDFLVHTDEPGAYDAEVMGLGGTILRCRVSPQQPLRYAVDLRRILREHPDYDVLHSHVHHFSGWVLAVGAIAGVRSRIAHSHGDTSSDDRRSSAPRRAYLSMMQGMLGLSATGGFACTKEAAAALYGRSWSSDRRWSVLRYGIDLEPFRAIAQTSLRHQLRIPPGAFVVGHVGRFVDVKNHAFLVAIAQAAQAANSDLHFLLVGEGPLRPEITQRIAELKLSRRFTFADPRNDVVTLMTSTMDAFVLPSLREGLPVVLVEAQAAGLPCLVSDTVSRESQVIEGLLFWESLSTPPEAWAARLAGLRSSRTGAEEPAWRAVEGSPFDIRSNLHQLQMYYREQSTA